MNQKQKETSLSDNIFISLKIEVHCGRYFSRSKVFCSEVEFTIVYDSKL